MYKSTQFLYEFMFTWLFFKPLRLLISGLRLHMTAVPLATASVIYHKFFRENSLQQYDPYVRKLIDLLSCQN